MGRTCEMACHPVPPPPPSLGWIYQPEPVVCLETALAPVCLVILSRAG